MINQIKSWARESLGKTAPGRLAALFLNSASMVRTHGWLRSAWENAAVDRHGQPLPWLTYPMIAFLNQRLRKEFQILECGSGNSTLWFAERVSKVITIENNPEWAQVLAPRLPANVDLRIHPSEPGKTYLEIAFGSGAEDNAYVDVITKEEGKFDVIIVDGVYRNACCRRAVERLLPGGVLILDNTDEPEFAWGREYLAGCGFRSLPFEGMCPIIQRTTCTSVFYRENNCFGI